MSGISSPRTWCAQKNLANCAMVSWNFVMVKTVQFYISNHSATLTKFNKLIHNYINIIITKPVLIYRQQVADCNNCQFYSTAMGLVGGDWICCT